MFLDKKIEIYFQPIISIKDKKIFAYEALVRGFNSDNITISPAILFEEAIKNNVLEKFDSYLRELALKKFVNYYYKDNNLLLFLNFESSIVQRSIQNSTHLEFTQLVESLKIPKKNIVLEIKEDTIKDSEALKEFCKYYKELGYIIALDDFGTGYSSFDRIALVQPDIVKIDRSLLSNIHNNFINIAILKSIVSICHKIGALTLAEGVEKNKEVLTCMKNHVDIFQGFFFEKAKETISMQIKQNIIEKINHIGQRYKTVVNEHIREKREIFKNMKLLTKDIVNIVSNEQLFNLETIKRLMISNNHIEAIYLIDYFTGLQIQDTLIDTNENSFYQATKDGHDHTLKEYYYITIESQKEEFLSQKYISKATGSTCRTYAKAILIKNYKYIICFDIVEK